VQYAINWFTGQETGMHRYRIGAAPRMLLHDEA
jgi:hypothetical protein